jgi:hypothetical protein
MPFSVLYNIYQKQGLTIPLESSYFQYSTPPTADFEIHSLRDRPRGRLPKG